MKTLLKMNQIMPGKVSVILAIVGYSICNNQSACAQVRYTSTKATQEYTEPNKYLGIGLGLDYGGLGFRFEFIPLKYLGVFGSVGYNFAGIGINAGASFKALPNKRLTPVVLGMIGYNGVIVIQNASQYNKIYFGPTVGLGGEWKLGRKSNKLSVGLLYPFRNQKFKDDMDDLKLNPAIKIEQDASPIAFSVGFNLSL